MNHGNEKLDKNITAFQVEMKNQVTTALGRESNVKGKIHLT